MSLRSARRAEAEKERVKRVRSAKDEQMVETREIQRSSETCGSGRGKGAHGGKGGVRSNVLPQCARMSRDEEKEETKDEEEREEYWQEVRNIAMRMRQCEEASENKSDVKRVGDKSDVKRVT